MSRDIAARLRESCGPHGMICLDDLREAADEIDRLRAVSSKRHRRWAVIALDDNCSPRAGYAYLYKEKPENTAVSGIGRHATACIEIEFCEGEGLTNIPGSFELKPSRANAG